MVHTHSNMHHTYILCTSKQKSHISQRALIRDKSKKNIATYFIHNLEQILFHLSRAKTAELLVTLPLFQQNLVPIFEPIFFITLSVFTLPLFCRIFDHFAWLLEPIFVHVAFLGQFSFTLPGTIREIYIRQSLKASLKLCMYCHIQLHTADHSLTTQQ